MREEQGIAYSPQITYHVYRPEDLAPVPFLLKVWIVSRELAKALVSRIITRKDKEKSPF